MVSMLLIKVSFIFFSIIIAILDVKTGEVPRIVFIIAFVFFVLLKMLIYEEILFFESIAGFLGGLLVFLLACVISGRRLGLADVWYSALTGMVLGPWWWYGAISTACIAGAVYIFALKRREIPFIPFMALGSTVMSIIQGWRL